MEGWKRDRRTGGGLQRFTTHPETQINLHFKFVPYWLPSEFKLTPPPHLTQHVILLFIREIRWLQNSLEIYGRRLKMWLTVISDAVSCTSWGLDTTDWKDPPLQLGWYPLGCDPNDCNGALNLESVCSPLRLMALWPDPTSWRPITPLFYLFLLHVILDPAGLECSLPRKHDMWYVTHFVGIHVHKFNKRSHAL